MIEIGCLARFFNRYEDEVNFAKENDFDFMQLWYDSRGLCLHKEDENPINVIKSYDFKTIIHAVLDINEFEEHIPKLLEILKELNHNELIIHPICHSEDINDNTLEKLDKCIKYTLNMYREHNIKVFLENNSKLDPIFTDSYEIKKIFSDNEELEFILDIAHIDDMNRLREMVSIKMPKILHIADRHYDVVHEHLPIGQGDINFEYIFKDILRDYKGKIILEIIKEDMDIINSRNSIKNIVNKLEEEVNDVKKLVKVCNAYDNTDIDFSSDINDDEIMKCLVYDDDNLTSYFGIVKTSNFSKNYAWGVINPSYRNEENYEKILKFLSSKCINNNIDTLNLINDRELTYLKEFISKSKSEYLYSTYDMKFRNNDYNDCNVNNICLKEASIKDLEDIVLIGMEAFETNKDEETEYNKSNLNDDKYHNFIGVVDEKIIGIISVRIEDNEASISDLAVYKSFRNKGFGKAILSNTIDYMISKGIKDFSLSVETRNENALKLYKDCGFDIIKINDCYEVKLT